MKNSEKLYPIILFTYNRPWHTEQVLQALEKNELADQSHLIVFVDGPKANASEEQLKKIKQVRELVQSKKWCGSVEYHIAEQNIGCRNSIIAGITQVLSTYEAAIILEDDIVTSPYFLKYMNTCLNYYRVFKSVISISGYNLPPNRIKIPNEYKYDVYVSLRQQNWGWGTWRDRWESVDWDKNFIKDFIADKTLVEAFNRGGDDLSKMLQEEYEGKSDAWDIQFTFHHFKHHGVSIIPCKSYTNNVGLDSSGTHTINQHTSSFFNDLSMAAENPKLLNIVYEDIRLINAFYNAYSAKKRPLWQKAINRLSRILGGENVFVIKKKVYVD